jgi:hypothetical protein
MSWLTLNSNVGALAECFNWFMAGQRDGWMLTKPYFQPPVLLYPRKWFRCNKAKERRDAGQMLMPRVYLYSNVSPRVRFLVYVALVHARPYVMLRGNWLLFGFLPKYSIAPE